MAGLVAHFRLDVQYLLVSGFFLRIEGINGNPTWLFQ